MKKAFLRPKPYQQLAGESSLLSWHGFLAFFLGISAAFQVSVVGTISVQELAFGVLAPYYLLLNFNRFPKEFNYILYALCLWLVIQVCTDMVRVIPLRDIAKGSARIIFFGCGLITLFGFLAGNRLKFSAYLAGWAASFVVMYFIYPGERGYIEPWKWYFSGAVTTFALALLCHVNLRVSGFVWAGVLISIGIVSALQNFRSHAAVLILIGLRIVVEPLFLKFPVFARIMLVAGGGFAILSTYVALASTGALGESAEAKFRAQYSEEVGVVSILKGGRAEYRASSEAIKNSPLLGYGSWAQHPEYVYLLIDESYSGFTPGEYAGMLEVGVIPTHSYLFGTWVDAGFIPAILWAVLWLWCFYVVLSIKTSGGWLPKLVLCLATWLLWDILFSPFGLGARAVAAFSIVSIVYAAPYWMPKKRLLK